MRRLIPLFFGCACVSPLQVDDESLREGFRRGFAASSGINLEAAERFLGEEDPCRHQVAVLSLVQGTHSMMCPSHTAMMIDQAASGVLVVYCMCEGQAPIRMTEQR